MIRRLVALALLMFFVASLGCRTAIAKPVDQAA